ncbi:MAG: hypothetical protein R2714_01600 [Microthrixaceae bacterium]
MKRARRPRPAELAMDPELRELVETKFELRVSHKTIHRSPVSQP